MSLDDSGPPARRTTTPPAVVAFGGGHGLAASLAALRRVTDRLTAVVTVADDGGSSGRLREELDALPPGDLRMALAALAGDDTWGETWARLLQHRFRGPGPLAGHAVGNLLLTGLAEVTGDPVAALALTARLLGVPPESRVLPLAVVPLDIVADVAGFDPADPGALASVRGQVAVATTPGRVVAVSLVPAAPPACPEALAAIRDADWVVLGPGSWFTSVLPHLLVPDVATALAETAARTVVTLNLAPQHGETEGFSPEAHLEVLAAHAPDLSIDVIVADPQSVLDIRGLMTAASDLGARLVLADVTLGDGTPRHDPARLAPVYAAVFADAHLGAPGAPVPPGGGDPAHPGPHVSPVGQQ